MSDPTPADRDAADLRAFLAERDVACPGCGYNLKGLVGRSCPECNRVLLLSELRYQLSGPDPRTRSPWAAASVVVGWIGLAGSSWLNTGWHGGSDAQAGLALIPAIYSVFLALPLILLCLLSLPRGIAGVISAVAWLLVAGMVLLAVVIWF